MNFPTEDFIKLSPFAVANPVESEQTNTLLLRLATAKLELDRRGIQPKGRGEKKDASKKA